MRDSSISRNTNSKSCIACFINLSAPDRGRAPFFFSIYLTGQKMNSQLNENPVGLRVAKAGVSLICAAVMSACANYAGIHSDQQMAKPQAYQSTQSIPEQNGHWPAAGWADQFGDAQLKALLDE